MPLNETEFADWLQGASPASMKPEAPAAPMNEAQFAQWIATQRQPKFPPLGPIGSAMQQQPKPRGTFSSLGHGLMEGVLPGLGAIGGGAAGLASPLPGGTYIGEALGSAGGEALNQLTGLKHTSVTKDGLDWGDIGWSGAAPAIGRGVLAAGKKALNVGARMLPGAGAPIQEWAAGKAKDASAWLKNQVGDVNALYDAVKSHNPVIQTPNLDKATMAMMMHERGGVSPALRNDTLDTLASGLRNDMQQTGQQGLPFEWVYSNLKRINQRIRSTTGEEQHAYSELKKALWEDIKLGSRSTNQTVTTAGKSLIDANAAFRKQLASEEFEHVLQQATQSRSGDQLTTFNRRIVDKALRDNEIITKNLTAGELAYLKQQMKGLGIIPAMPAPPGANTGTARYYIGSGAGGLAGSAAGPMGMGIGAAAVPALMFGIEKAAQTGPGRRAITNMATTTLPAITPEMAAYLSAIMSGAVQDPSQR